MLWPPRKFLAVGPFCTTSLFLPASALLPRPLTLLELRRSQQRWHVDPAGGEDIVSVALLVELQGRVREEGVKADEDPKADAKAARRGNARGGTNAQARRPRQGCSLLSLKCLHFCRRGHVKDIKGREDVLLVVALNHRA
jgi:hypothetical protein